MDSLLCGWVAGLRACRCLLVPCAASSSSFARTDSGPPKSLPAKIVSICERLLLARAAHDEPRLHRGGLEHPRGDEDHRGERQSAAPMPSAVQVAQAGRAARARSGGKGRNTSRRRSNRARGSVTCSRPDRRSRRARPARWGPPPPTKDTWSQRPSRGPPHASRSRRRRGCRRR